MLINRCILSGVVLVVPVVVVVVSRGRWINAALLMGIDVWLA